MLVLSVRFARSIRTGNGEQAGGGGIGQYRPRTREGAHAMERRWKGHHGGHAVEHYAHRVSALLQPTHHAHQTGVR
eukprot:9139335-Pyramimonas_sp.AAC.1